QRSTGTMLAAAASSPSARAITFARFANVIARADGEDAAAAGMGPVVRTKAVVLAWAFDLLYRDDDLDRIVSAPERFGELEGQRLRPRPQSRISSTRSGGREHGAVAPLDDGALEQLRVLHHERDQLVVRHPALAQPELGVDRLLPPQHVARS